MAAERATLWSEDLDAALARLLPFADERADEGGDDFREPLPMRRDDYLELVDWSGRVVVEGKRGAIDEHQPPILQRLGVDPDHYARFIRRETAGFGYVAGPVERMRQVAEGLSRSFFKGAGLARRLFPAPG